MTTKRGKEISANWKCSTFHCEGSYVTTAIWTERDIQEGSMQPFF